MCNWFSGLRRVGVGFKKLQPIVERVRDVEATEAGEIAVELHTVASGK